jgi:hypothetical protein
MKRAFLIISALILIQIFVVQASAQVEVQELIKIGEGRYWSPPPIHRNLPVYVRTAGNVVGRNWWKASLGWGSVALICGSVAMDFYEAYYGETAIEAFLDKIGVRKSGTEWQKTNGYEYQPSDPGMLTDIQTYLTTYNKTPNYIKWYVSEAAADAAANDITSVPRMYEAAYTSAGNTRQLFTNSGIRAGYLHSQHGGNCVSYAAGVTIYLVMAFPRGSGSVVQVPAWVNRTSGEILTDISTGWSTTAGDDIDKGAAEVIEEKIKQDLDNSNYTGSTSVLDDVNPNNSKTTKENAEEAIEDDISGETDPDTEGEGFLEQILKTIQDLPGKIVTALTSLIGLSDPAPTYTSDPDENTTVIGEEGIETQKTTEQAETESVLDTLWDSVGGLRDTINAKITALLGAGGACSPWTETVYGSEFKLDLCVIDWSPWRAAIIALGCICACFILIGL